MDNKNISFEPIGGDLFNVVYGKELTITNPKMQTSLLEKIFACEPYNFEVAFELAKRHAAAGNYQKACEVRFRAATEAVESIPEDEEYLELNWEDEENREFVEIIVASGTDFYMHGDFEMAAALFETALGLDPEDHTDITPQLALSYIAIEDWDGYDQLKNDFTQGSATEALVENFAAFRQGRKSTVKMPRELVDEICADDHHVDDTFFVEVDKERVSKNASARELWYKHLPVFDVFGAFVDQYRQK